jgi:hypothetical protein
MEVLLPVGVWPIKEGVYPAKYGARNGYCAAKGGLRAGFDPEKDHEGHSLPYYRAENQAYFKGVQCVAETTDWFSTAEYIPPQVGWYECRVIYNIGSRKDGEEHPNPYMFHWNGMTWDKGGNIFGSNHAYPDNNAVINANPVVFFRGINIQTQEKE